MNKKLFLISAIACCCSLSSCDMDLTPETNIATDESVRNVGDCEKYSNLFHAEWRGYIQGSIAATELVQSGQVVATPDYLQMGLPDHGWNHTELLVQQL